MSHGASDQIGEVGAESAAAAFPSNKGWADKAIAQLPDEKLHVARDCRVTLNNGVSNA
jgi:hypothetical protein